MLKAKVEGDRRWARCLVTINSQNYIVDTKDVRNPDHSFIECVSNGRCVIKRIVPTVQAPEVIVALLKRYARHGGFVRLIGEECVA